jgi:hypothetical protein
LENQGEQNVLISVCAHGHSGCINEGSNPE